MHGLLRRQRDRRAFTLLEIVLALGLVVALTAIAWPNIVTMQEADKLQRAADDFRGLLVGLRVRAMEESAVYELSIPSEDYTYSIAKVGETLPPETEKPTRGEYDAAPGHYALEEGLRFNIDPMDSLSTSSSASPSSTTSVNEDGALVVRFQPDGSASNAEFAILDETDMAMAVQMRGLTGVIHVVGPKKWAGK